MPPVSPGPVSPASAGNAPVRAAPATSAARAATGNRRRLGAVLVGVLLLLLVWVFGLPGGSAPPGSPPSSGLQVSATLQRIPVPPQDGRPVLLSPPKDLAVHLEVRNRSGRPVEVSSVKLSGRVLGMTFFSYRARVDLQLGPGESQQRDFAFDLTDLGGQATGLLPARLDLLGPDGASLADQRFAVRVDGSLRSAYGVFGLVVLLATLSFVAAVMAQIAFHRLERSAVLRGIRFAVPGLGIGLTLTISLSALGIMVPSDGRSLAFVLVLGICGFLVGALLPEPEAEGRAGSIIITASEPHRVELPRGPLGPAQADHPLVPEEPLPPIGSPAAPPPPPPPPPAPAPAPSSPAAPSPAPSAPTPPPPAAAAAAAAPLGPPRATPPPGGPRLSIAAQFATPTAPVRGAPAVAGAANTAGAGTDPRVYPVVAFADWADFVPDVTGVPARRTAGTDEPPAQVHRSPGW